MVETCEDCWAAELPFLGPPGVDEVVEYIDIRFIPAMMKARENLFPPSGFEPTSTSGWSLKSVP